MKTALRISPNYFKGAILITKGADTIKTVWTYLVTSNVSQKRISLDLALYAAGELLKFEMTLAEDHYYFAINLRVISGMREDSDQVWKRSFLAQVNRENYDWAMSHGLNISEILNLKLGQMRLEHEG